MTPTLNARGLELKANLQAVNNQIVAACQSCGRDPSLVTLVAVSKTRPAEDVQQALLGGARHFGENYAQELRDKADLLITERAIQWHFIGALQRNKVKYVVGRAKLVHDVDNLALAEEISKRSMAAPTPILLGVNIGQEPQKSGWMPDQVLEVLPKIIALPGVQLQGLMCIPPARENPDDVAPFFAELADIAARGRAAGFALDTLSMGMSHDFAVAIRHGATLVRVGTAIFGQRSNNPPVAADAQAG